MEGGDINKKLAREGAKADYEFEGKSLHHMMLSQQSCDCLLDFFSSSVYTTYAYNL
jgi:hypothetical protein